MVVEIPVPSGPGALKKFEDPYTPAFLRTRGLVLKSKERGDQDGTPWLVLKTELTRDETKHIQWIFCYESREDRFAQVQATAPADQFPAIENDVKAMLGSLRWDARGAAAIADRFYSITPPKGWKLAKQVGPVDMYTESGRFPKAKDESAIRVMLLNDQPRDFKAYVKRQNLRRNHYSGMKELESRFVEIDGNEANFSLVSGTDLTDKRPVVLHYCYIAAGPAIVFIEGERTAKLDQKLFEETCKTIKIKQ